MLNYKKRFLAAILSVLMIICFMPSIQAAKTVKLQTVKSSKYDLDGDGKKDSLVVEAYGYHWKDSEYGGDVSRILFLRLEINGKVFVVDREEEYDCYVDKLHIMDFDKTDGKRDIALALRHEDAQGVLLILQYDGKNIKCVGDIYVESFAWLRENRPITDGQGNIFIGYSDLGYIFASGVSRHSLKNGKYVQNAYFYTSNPYDLRDLGLSRNLCTPGISQIKHETLSPKKMTSWERINPQLGTRMVHFLLTSFATRKSIFINDSSEGKTDFVFVALRSCRWNPSMMFVV